MVLGLCKEVKVGTELHHSDICACFNKFVFILLHLKEVVELNYSNI